MRKILNITALALIALSFFAQGSFAQVAGLKLSKREIQRRAMHSRDSILKLLNKSDTSISNLLQTVEHYTTDYNQINNTLAEGLDTVDISTQLPPIVKRIDKITLLSNTHKSSTLRYLFVLRDNLDHMQQQLDVWQVELENVNTKLIQNQNDLVKFHKDSTLKIVPRDSAVRVAFFEQLKDIKHLWHEVDSANRKALLRVNLLQDKISVSYTKILDESDHIDTKIKGFALKAIEGESTYIWDVDKQYNDFKTAFNSTINLNGLLFNYFIKSDLVTHGIALLFLAAVFSWLFYNRAKAIKNATGPESMFSEANYIHKHPAIAALLVATAITPYFYDHPPAVFLESLLLLSMLLALIIIKTSFNRSAHRFFFLLFALSVVYGVSNLFIELSNADRYIIFILSIISVAAGYTLYKKVKKTPEDYLPHTLTALTAFIALQSLSIILNITGRFSLAKIIGITAVFNLWLLIIFYVVINIIIEGLYLQFQVKKGGDSFINWMDYNLVKKKFKTTLMVIFALLWLFSLLQNLGIDDWAIGYANNILSEQQTIAGAAFTFGGFVIFIFVIWLSSVVSKIISYFYDVSARRVSDLSVAKKRNKTSTLLIRMAVFSVGFLLAVAASGFPLDKLTIIISAFGVGIGFGLQNVVNNLVSGLILAFEKPIQIGDTIEVDGVSGVIREIGIRSSKIATGDGAEVIIPNGDLISHHVVNWTLSNTNRQVGLLINVAYGAAVDKIKDHLKSLLAGRTDIMSIPGPAVFVNSVSAASVEFKVLFWAADINNVAQLKSAVLTDIHAWLTKEGIEMPAAQKDFYLHFPDGGPGFIADKKAADGLDEQGQKEGAAKIPKKANDKTSPGEAK